MPDTPTPDPARDTPDVPGHALIRQLGRGPCARTWLATQRSMQRNVVVKLLELPDEAARQRFETGLRAVSHLSHPGIAPIHLVGRTGDGQVFYTMPWLPEDITSQPGLQRKSLRIVQVMRTVLASLGHAHRHGIVHGGIKPSNLRLDEQGRVLLCDFGLAQSAHASGMPLPSVAAAWMSPDQVRGGAPDAGADLYALAIVAWDLLTGALPFQGSDALSIAMAHVQQPVPRLPAMLGAWQGWMDKALAKAPATRFRNAREMAAALAGIDGHHNAELPERPATALPWRRWAVAGGATAGLAVLAIAAWAFFAQPRIAEPRHVNVIGAPPPPVAAATLAVAAPAATTAASNLLEQANTLVARGDDLRTRGRLFAPAGADALTAYLAAQNLDPGNVGASAGMGSLLATQQKQLDAAWQANQLDRVPELLAHGDLAAAHATIKARRAWRTARGQLAAAVGNAVVAAATARDLRRLDTLKPLVALVPAVFPDGFDMATAEQRATALHAGDVLRDPAGPALVYVPASGHTLAYAIARTDVTRADYAAFVQATHRPAARCVEPYNLFSRLRNLTWSAPGFAQEGDHPVVCVSWSDANAYAAWLSQRTGQAYRLPNDADWQRAAQGMPRIGACQLGNIDDSSRKDGGDSWPCSDGTPFTAPVGHFAASGVGIYDMYGNVSQWLSGSPGTFRGLSWRAGRNKSPLDAASHTSASTGYDNIGFRVLRVIDAAHPAPARVVGH